MQPTTTENCNSFKWIAPDFSQRCDNIMFSTNVVLCAVSVLTSYPAIGKRQKISLQTLIKTKLSFMSLRLGSFSFRMWDYFLCVFLFFVFCNYRRANNLRPNMYSIRIRWEARAISLCCHLLLIRERARACGWIKPNHFLFQATFFYHYIWRMSPESHQINGIWEQICCLVTIWKEKRKGINKPTME